MQDTVIHIGAGERQQKAIRYSKNMGFKVSLIQGPTYQGNYVTKSSLVTCLKTPYDPEKRMSTCRWAVTNGGGSMMEMMYLG